jgi:hypothetical protein
MPSDFERSILNPLSTAFPVSVSRTTLCISWGGNVYYCLEFEESHRLSRDIAISTAVNCEPLLIWA